MQAAYMPKSQFWRYLPNAGREEESPYFYLHGFLTRLPNYNEHHPCWSIFGRVNGLSFWDWMNGQGEAALITAEPVAVQFVEDGEIAAARKAGAAIVFINPKADFDSLMRDFLQVLEELGVVTEKKGRGRPKAVDEAERAGKMGTTFVLEGVPQIKRLRQALHVKALTDASHDPEDVAERAGLATYTKGDLEGEKKERRDAVESVRRALADYHSIIEGLSLPTPKFPVFPS